MAVCTETFKCSFQREQLSIIRQSLRWQFGQSTVLSEEQPPIRSVYSFALHTRKALENRRAKNQESRSLPKFLPTPPWGNQAGISSIERFFPRAHAD